MSAYTSENDTLDGVLYHSPDPKFKIEKGLGEYLLEAMKLNQDKTALIDPLTGKKETYKELLSKSMQTAQALIKKGVTSNDILSLCCYNNMDYSATVLAAFFIGVRLAPIDPSSPLSDVTYNLRSIMPRIIFCDNDLENMVEAAITAIGSKTEIVVFGDSQKHTSYSSYLTTSLPEDSFEVTPVKNIFDTALIHFSSGTTGFSKPVCVTNYAMYFLSKHLANSMSCKTLMTLTSPFWISNMNFLVMSILSGRARVIAKMFDENTTVKICQDYEVDFLILTPNNGIKLSQNPKYYQYDTTKLKVVGVGGSPSTPEQMINLIKIFPYSDIYQGLGMTEVGGVMFYMIKQNETELLEKNSTSFGTIIPGIQYKVVDIETDKILGPNQPGELRLKYPGITTPYLNQSEACINAFDNHGYLKTGDMVYYDNDYKFYYVTRLKDIFKYLGWHISPTLIETELLKHSNIQETVVVGIPSKTEGEYPAAIVVLKDKCTATSNDIAEYIKERLPERYWLRGGVYIVARIPTTATGKPKRRDVRELILKQI